MNQPRQRASALDVLRGLIVQESHIQTKGGKPDCCLVYVAPGNAVEKQVPKPESTEGQGWTA